MHLFCAINANVLCHNSYICINHNDMMKKPIDELKQQYQYRAVTFISGRLKNRFLKDCELGKKPAEILRQALEEYYNKPNNGTY